ELLAAHYLERTSRKLRRPARVLSAAEKRILRAYHWPGNVRELQNVIERAVITDRGGPLSFDLPEGSTPPLTATAMATDSDVLSEEEMKRLERDNVLRALEQTRWRVYGPTGAASLLGIKPTTLASRMKRMGLARPRSGAVERRAG
ncbi:MAG: helix-turn-helix domain-containing protein, partial [Longimicrobiales bacterium]